MPPESTIPWDDKVTICIPTHMRPKVLPLAIDSCLTQTFRNFTIIISDDSQNTETEEVVARYQAAYPGLIRYVRNVGSKYQHGNVNQLFSMVETSRFVLLHDDDQLMPHTLETLATCWREHPALDLAFGRQLYIDETGKALPSITRRLNRRYERTAANRGLLPHPLFAGISRMMPMNSYMIRTSLAQAAGYRSYSEVGNACDTDFAIRVCEKATAVCYVDKLVSKYRISPDAISRVRQPLEALTYAMVKQAPVPQSIEHLRRRVLRRTTQYTVTDLARVGRWEAAKKVFLSKDYSFIDRLKPRHFFNGLLLLLRPYPARADLPKLLDTI